jgi:hypothetical protein
MECCTGLSFWVVADRTFNSFWCHERCGLRFWSWLMLTLLGI